MAATAITLITAVEAVSFAQVVQVVQPFATMAQHHVPLGWLSTSTTVRSGGRWMACGTNGGPGNSSGIFTNVSGTFYPTVNLALQYFNNTKATLRACASEQLYGPPAGFQGWE